MPSLCFTCMRFFGIIISAVFTAKNVCLQEDIYKNEYTKVFEAEGLRGFCL